LAIKIRIDSRHRTSKKKVQNDLRSGDGRNGEKNPTRGRRHVEKTRKRGKKAEWTNSQKQGPRKKPCFLIRRRGCDGRVENFQPENAHTFPRRGGFQKVKILEGRRKRGGGRQKRRGKKEYFICGRLLGQKIRGVKRAIEKRKERLTSRGLKRKKKGGWAMARGE